MKGDATRLRVSDTVGEMHLASEVAFAAIVVEPHLDWSPSLWRKGAIAVTEALRPKVIGLVPPTHDPPVTDKRLPSDSSIQIAIDLITHVRVGRITRSDMCGGVDMGGRAFTWRREFQSDSRGVKGSLDNVNSGLRKCGPCGNNGSLR